MPYQLFSLTEAFRLSILRPFVDPETSVGSGEILVGDGKPTAPGKERRVRCLDEGLRSSGCSRYATIRSACSGGLPHLCDAVFPNLFFVKLDSQPGPGQYFDVPFPFGHIFVGEDPPGDIINFRLGSRCAPFGSHPHLGLGRGHGKVSARLPTHFVGISSSHDAWNASRFGESGNLLGAIQATIL